MKLAKVFLNLVSLLEEVAGRIKPASVRGWRARTWPYAGDAGFPAPARKSIPFRPRSSAATQQAQL